MTATTASVDAEGRRDVRRPRRSPGRPRRSPMARREARWAYLFLAPWIIGFLAFTAGPMIASLWLSFTEYDVINAPRFTGLDNYQRLMSDPAVARSLGNTVYYTLLHVPLAMAISLGLALLLNRVNRLRGFFRTIFYLPAMTPAVAVGILFLLLLNTQEGLINRALGLVGVRGPSWTTDPDWVLPGIVLMSLWSLGSTVIIYLAALQNVPRDLYEAASIDGAGAWARFRSVTLPMISGALFFTLIVNTISSLQMFTEVYTMYFGNQQTQGRFNSDAAQFYVIHLFQEAFQFLHMGYASALAWLLFLIILAITLLQLRLGERFVFYEGDDPSPERG